MEHNQFMSDKTYEEVLQKYLDKGQLIRSRDLSELNIPRVVLTRMLREGRIERVNRGLYRSYNSYSIDLDKEGLTEIATRVPQAIFCLFSALEFHGIGSSKPKEIWFAMPRGSHKPRISYPPIKMLQFSSTNFSTGVETHNFNGIKIQLFGIGKTIVDCFAFRNKIGLDVAIEALKEVKKRNIVRNDELWLIAETCRMQKVMQPYLEAIS